MQMPNAQGIVGLMAQGRTPQQPQAPRAPMPVNASPMAGLGSVEDRVAAYRGNPAPLQQRYAISQDLLDLLALQKIKSEKDAAARQMQMQLAQQQAAQGESEMTVAQQREKEVMDMTRQELARQRGATAQQQGQQMQENLQRAMAGGVAQAPGAAIAAQPQAMAAGGIVAFTEGGETSGKDSLDPKTSALMDYLRGIPYTLGMPGAAERAQGAKRLQESSQRFGPEWQQRREELLKMSEAARSAEPGVLEPLSAKERLERERIAAELRAKERAAIEPPKPVRMMPPEAADTQQFGTSAAPAGIALLPAARPRIMAGPAAPAESAGPARPLAQQINPILPSRPTFANIPAVTKPEGLEASMRADYARDPEAAGRAMEERVRAAYALTPEQRAVYEKGIAEREKMYQQTYDPQRMRDEGLIRFLIGAGGRRYGELGAGAAASLDYQKEMDAARLAEAANIQKMREGLVGQEREGIKPSIEGGLKSLEQARMGRSAAQTAAENVYGTDVKARSDAERRETELYGHDVNLYAQQLHRQIEANRIASEAITRSAQREEFNWTKRQQALTAVRAKKDDSVNKILRYYAPQQQAYELQLQANPNNKDALAKLKDLATERDKMIVDRTRGFDDDIEALEASMFGKSGTTGGYKLVGARAK